MNAKSKIRILVVEDESLVGRDIHHMLRGLGYEVIDVVSRGDDAVAIAESSQPDLVLMDIVLKGRDRRDHRGRADLGTERGPDHLPHGLRR